VLSVVVNDAEPVPIRARRGSQRLYLYCVQDFRLRDDADFRDVPLAFELAGYIYTLLNASIDEIVAYHWHHQTREGLAFPHLHIGPAALGRDAVVLPGEFHKVHFPTGQVTLSDFVRLAITEFGVEPRRADWAAILAQQA
jgi:hypothetical protein